MKAGLKRLGLLGGSVAMVMVVPMLTNFLGDRAEVTVQDLILPFGFDLLVAALITGAFWRLYRRRPLTGYVAAVLSAIIIGTGYEARLGQIYGLIGALIPVSGLGGLEGSVYSLAFMLIIGVLSWLVGRAVAGVAKRFNWRERDVPRAIAIAISLTFVFQAVPSAVTIIQSWPQYFYKPPMLAAQTHTTSATPKPDIYYIVLDRYASQDVLKNQFGYDNSDFINFLTDLGYYSDPDTHQNYPYTTMSISSTLNAGYHGDAIDKFSQSPTQTIIPYHRSIQYASVTQELKSLGYSYDQIGTWYEASDQAPLADHMYMQDSQLTLLGHTVTINNFTKNEMEQGPLWRFISAGIRLGKFTIAGYKGQDQVEMTQYALGKLQDLANQPQGGRFIFAHLLIPHDPYFFNADGSLSTNPNSDNTGEPIKQKYLAQVQYINSQIKPILSSINVKSHGQAVVILQSDEGPYPVQLNDEVFDDGDVESEINDSDMRRWSDANLAMKFGNLAAYHIPAAPAEALQAGADNADVFRVVFNSYFGANLPYQDECYYAYSDGRHSPFVYSDITKRLDPASTAKCAANGTGP